MQWIPSTWWLSGVPSRPSISIDRLSDTGMYAVREGGYCLNRNGEWEYEPLPSNRTDGFKERCRFESLLEAQTIAEKSIESKS